MKKFKISKKVAEKIKNKLDAGKYVHGIYLLTLSDNPSNLFEIIPAADPRHIYQILFIQ